MKRIETSAHAYEGTLTVREKRRRVFCVGLPKGATLVAVECEGAFVVDDMRALRTLDIIRGGIDAYTLPDLVEMLSGFARGAEGKTPLLLGAEPNTTENQNDAS